MNYTGMICDGCREPFEDGDDIVVCPECGTPQHRSCYEKNNRCVNEYLHSPDFSWSQPQNATEPVQMQESAEQNEQSEPVQNTGNTVPLRPTTPQQMEDVFMRGVLYDPKDDIGGATVGEAADYIQSGVPRYISRLMKHKNKKLSWNWAAFFFSPFWFFYRKLYKAGAVFLALSISLTLIISPAVEKLQSQMEPIANQYAENVTNGDDSAETEAANDELLAQMQEVVDNGYPTILLEFLSIIVPNIIAALLADYLLKRKMLKVVDLSHEGSSDINTVKYTIMRKGGVSVIMPMVAVLIDTYLPSLLLSIAYNIK